MKILSIIIIIIIYSCNTTNQVQYIPITKKLNGHTLYQQKPDTIRIGKTLIIKNWSTNEKFIIDSSVSE